MIASDIGGATRQAAAGFMAWWLGELGAMVPPVLRRRLRPEPRAAVLELGPAGARLREVVGGADRVVAALGAGPEGGPDGSDAPDALKERLRRYRAQGWMVGLQIDDERLLRDEILLPAAASENLREVVAFQIDRLSPFARDEVAFDCRLVDGAAPSGQVRVELIVLPLPALNEALGRARALGVEPDFTSYAGDSIRRERRFNLAAGAETRRARRAPWALNAALSALALVLAATALYLPIERDRRIAAALEARLEVARANAKVGDRLRAEVDERVSGVTALIGAKRTTPSATRLINDLSALLPDSVWLSQLRLNGSKVQIVGYAPSAGDVVGLIETSGQFRGAKFLAPARRIDRMGLEQFNLSFDYAPTEAP